MKLGVRKRVTLALASVAAMVFCAAAYAMSDLQMASDIRAETQKVVSELTVKAAELRAKGEWPKTGPLTAASLPCSQQVPVRPFVAWGDFADYTPLAGGSFEQPLTRWKLENTAKVVAGQTPFATGAKVLQMPKGSKVSTAAVCITQLHPTIRFYARSKGSLGSRLRVEVRYEDLGGSVNTLTIGWLRPSASWSPTVIVPISANVRAAVAQSKTAAVAFQFSVEGDNGEWYVDDIYVDPWKIH